MAKMQKYMFDLDFGRADQTPAVLEAEDPDAEPEIEEEPEPPPPTFTEEDLAIARDAAFAEGHESGLAEAAESIEQQIAQALGSITAQMDGVFRKQEDCNDVNARNAARIAMSVIRKILPAACEKHAFDEVARVVEEVVGHILDEPRIIVRLAANLVEPVRERLEAVAQAHGFEGRVVVQADPRLSPGDCRVEWTDGGAERDQARLLEDIDAAAERALALPDRALAQREGNGDSAAVDEFSGT